MFRRGCSKQANTVRMKTIRYSIGYMTGTGESLADTHIHMNRHMEAGGATLGFTVL